MALESLVCDTSVVNYKPSISSARASALSEVMKRYDSAVQFNRGYRIGEVSARIKDLYSLANGTYSRVNIHGKLLKLNRRVDRATVAAQKVRNLGDEVSSAVNCGSLSSEEAREILCHVKDILDTAFSEKKNTSGKIGVHKSHYLNDVYKPDNPFAYLRAAKGKITRASKRTQSFQYSGLPAQMFIMEEGVKTYYVGELEENQVLKYTKS